MIRALKRHTCGKCNFSTSRKFNLVRHFERKHQTQSTFNGHEKQGKRVQNGRGSHTSQYGCGVQAETSHQHVSNPHPYVHPYLNHANQQPNTYPQRTPMMVANNMHYAEETRAPTKISVGPNGPRAPTTVSVPPQIGGLQQGSGIGDQFHRPLQNSFHGVRQDANNRAQLNIMNLDQWLELQQLFIFHL